MDIPCGHAPTCLRTMLPGPWRRALWTISRRAVGNRRFGRSRVRSHLSSRPARAAAMIARHGSSARVGRLRRGFLRPPVRAVGLRSRARRTPCPTAGMGQPNGDGLVPASRQAPRANRRPRPDCRTRGARGRGCCRSRRRRCRGRTGLRHLADAGEDGHHPLRAYRTEAELARDAPCSASDGRLYQPHGRPGPRTPVAAWSLRRIPERRFRVYRPPTPA